MSTAFYSAASYKPQVLSRTEGFHLPSPAPSTPPSSESTPAGSNNNFDTNNLFISPPSYLSVPETFRKFPGPSPDSSSSMDFTEELASLISNPASASSGHHHHHPSSHERSTHSPANAYDDYRPHTHNIFDISAPTHHSHHTSSHQQQYASASSAFSLPPSTSIHHHGSIHGHHAASLHNHSSQPHPLHDFAPHSHFNSTVPAIGSSMRYEPPGSSHGGEPSSVSSFNSHMSGMSNFSNTTTTSDSYHNNGGMRQTPSPVGGNGGAQEGFAGSNRSRSRSRASANGAAAPVDPPSTNGGPARRTRTKRNSVSSVSPPPLQRHAQPLVIPGSNSGSGRGPASPLSLHTNGWFIPSNGSQQGGEFSLPTPESVHGGFSGFTNPLGVSPKDVNGLVLNNVGGVGIPGPGMGGVTTVSMKGESPPGDMATKQAMLANEKRRRRRESHNAVERRRRDNINEKISELATLIPECLLDPAAPASAGNEDGLLSPTSPVDIDDEKETAKDKEAKDKDGAAVKANKGMILRKSVEYIRYLQQLVTAQASRNRDLEQQLQTYRNGGIPTPSSLSSLPSSNPLIPGSGEDDMGGLLLHDEVDGQLPSSLSSSSPSSTSTVVRKRSQSTTSKRFNGFELESVEEMDMEDDPSASGAGGGAESASTTKQFPRAESSGNDHDEDMERPSTMGGMSMSLSPSGSGSFDEDGASDDDGEGQQGQERGRKIGRRDAEVKVKEEAGMEMS